MRSSTLLCRRQKSALVTLATQIIKVSVVMEEQQSPLDDEWTGSVGGSGLLTRGVESSWVDGARVTAVHDSAV